MNVKNKISKEWYLMWEVLEEYICWKISLERGSWAYICLSWCEWTQGNWGADKTGGTVFYLIWANILNWREYFRKLLHQRTVQVVSLRLVSVCCGSFGFVHSELGGWGQGGWGGKRGSGGPRLLFLHVFTWPPNICYTFITISFCVMCTWGLPWFLLCLTNFQKHKRTTRTKI